MAIEQVVSSTPTSDLGTRSRAIDEGAGLLDVWAGLGVSLAEQATTATFGTIRDARWLTQQTVTTLLNTVENLQQMSMRLARGATERADQVGGRMIDESERAVLRTIGTFRRAVNNATGFASDTATSIVGRRSSSVAVS